MFYHLCRRRLLLLLFGFVLPGVRHVCGIQIHTPTEVEAVSGTDVKLKCTFSSTHPVSLQSVTVSWTFRGIDSKTDESVFYYREDGYPPEEGRFKGRVVWSGDVTRKDASITLQKVPQTFNGTYVCQVRNPPDVHGSNGEIVLKVVNKVSLSDIAVLAAVVGGACGGVLVLLAICVTVRFCRRKRKEHGIEMQTEEFEKRRDPTVCSPAEAIHLTVTKKVKEDQSSDDEESEPSSGDGEEEDGLSGEEDDDDAVDDDD